MSGHDSHAKYRRCALILVLAAALTPAVSVAQDSNTGLETLTRRDQLLGWEAVGRIDLDQKQCTGALIATDLVLTAAHCVFDDASRPVPAEKIIFRAGYINGSAIREVGVARVVADPGYRPDQPNDSDNLRHDVALLKLVEPIPAAAAAPFVVAEPGTGTQVSVVSYAQGRSEAPSWQRACKVLARDAQLMAMDCDVTFGASGAPVLDRSGSRARIVSIISSGGEDKDGRPIAFGMKLPDVVEMLKARLNSGQTLSESPAAGAAPAPRFLGVGKGGFVMQGGSNVGSANAGSGTTRRDIGARFIKP